MLSAPLSARVALVGPELERSANLGLRVLAAALRAEGHQPALFALCSPHDFERVAQAIVQDRPDAVGISIAHEGSALLLTALPKRLRDLGYDRPIVAGGLFATLRARELLDASEELDGVIRHDGELSVVRLAEAAIGRCDLLDVPGIVARREGAVEEGAPCDFTGHTVWPWRGSQGLPKQLGFPTASMIASRGCQRSCAYCTVVALRQDAEARRLEAGHSTGLDAAVRRRSVQDIANEMAALVFEYGARVFEFQDDTFLPDNAEEAETFLRSLHGQMQVRGLPGCAISISMRQDQVTREVCTELANIGVVRATVGIEAVSRSLSRRLEREPSPVPARVVLGRLRRLGIVTSFQSLALGPDVTLDEVEDELEALSTVRGVPFELSRLEVYGGTVLARRLREQGRLRGCAFLRKIGYADQRVALLETWMSRIATRHFGKRSPARQLADLSYDIALAGRFYPHARLAPIEGLAARLVSRVNADQVHTAHALVALLRRADSSDRFLEPILFAAIRQDDALIRTIGDVAAVLNDEIQAVGADSAWTSTRGRGSVPPSAGPRDTEGHLPLFELEESDTVIMEAPPVIAVDVENRCAELASRTCLGSIRASDPGEAATATEAPPTHAEAGYIRAVVRVSTDGRGELVELVGAQGGLDVSEPAFQCVAQVLARHDLSNLAGESLTYEDPGPIG